MPPASAESERTAYGGQAVVYGRSTTIRFVLSDSSVNDVFYVDGSGDVFYNGSLNKCANSRSAGGARVRTFSAKSSQPTVEAIGTAQLVAGAAAVHLDSTCAGTIDPQSSYRVFLTPDNDTKGLYVASKTAAGFTVRESQGGRSGRTFLMPYPSNAPLRTGRCCSIRSTARKQRANLRIFTDASACETVA